MSATMTVDQTRPQKNALYRKITVRIIPFLFICYVISFLDRTNIGFAQLQMKHNLGFSNAMYGFGITVFYVGYVLCEVPSNLLLSKFGARRTFSRIMMVWGLLSMAMMLVSTPMHFYLLRFLLGVFEAGFFPGIVLYLTFWYPTSRRTGILAIFFAGVSIAGVFGGMVSGWIIRDMQGVMGMHGWQWMFVLEGLPAPLLAIAAYFYLEDHPHQAKWLSASEKLQLKNDFQQEKKKQSKAHHSFGETLRQPRVYMFSFIYFALACASLTLSFWLPQMIQEFGIQDVMMVSLYSVIPNAVGAVGVILIAQHSDRKKEWRFHFAVCTTVGSIALGLLILPLPNFALMLMVLSIATTSIYAALPIFWAVPTSYLSSTSAAGSIALISSIGNASGIISPWVVGQIKTHTGSMDNALHILAMLLFISGVALLFCTRRNKDGAVEGLPPPERASIKDVANEIGVGASPS